MKIISALCCFAATVSGQVNEPPIYYIESIDSAMLVQSPAWQPNLFPDEDHLQKQIYFVSGYFFSDLTKSNVLICGHRGLEDKWSPSLQLRTSGGGSLTDRGIKFHNSVEIYQTDSTRDALQSFDLIDLWGGCADKTPL